ncbi:NAD(P)H-dependent flavin oxidoreductase [Nocardia terpenica]|uniref:Oxidoreductase n=1 Tax=Nocardia terpenica TaxID=455432 RepID=A0A164NU79_9NOCA|nr:nitronate monooxygenase [Nocardia terpenica]KZM74731.1 oxidoreductase [Nocardia terpenica]NQE93648.1 nitronate monooxygenase [Nocardia terpenica]
MDILDRFRLDVPVVQAGMGNIAGGRLAAAVASAGGLGTIGLLPPDELRAAIGRVREEAVDRAVSVNLLMPFARRHHVRVCLEEHVDVVVLAFGGNRAVVQELREAGAFVLVLVGTEEQARAAVAWGADGLIAQGREAGGHLVGTVAALEFLPRVLPIAGSRPVLLAGGIANATDTAAALAEGAAGVVAGTRFVLTEESGAHREYKRRVLAAEKTLETTLFGLGWPARHRVVPTPVTERWCRPDGAARRLPSLINACSGPLARVVPESSAGSVLAKQRPWLPLFSPAVPVEGMPEQWVDHAALYAGDSALRMDRVIPAKQAVAELAGR